MVPKAVSLFAGAGGLDIGAQDAGFQTVFSAELDPHCVATLRRNSDDKIVWHGDVRELAPDQVAEMAGIKKGALALLHGGPPCQPFSQIGKQLGLRDPRGPLLFELLRFAEHFRPAAVLIEQVPAFLKTRESGGGLVKDLLVERFGALGYDLHVDILDATAYGVPQRRKRAFLVAVPTGTSFEFSLQMSRPVVTVGEVIDDLPPSVRPGRTPLVPNHIDVTPARDRERISYVPEGGWLSKVPDAPPEIRRKLTRKDTTKFRRLDRKLPSLTLRCGEALYHPTKDRYVTPREAARIQGFPDSHVLEGPIRRRTGAVRDLDQHRQVANAVPPPLACAVAQDIGRALCLM